jgi:acetylornithine deacetylase
MSHPSSGSSPTSLAMLERLIAFDTTSARSNLEMIDFISAYFAEMGVDSYLTHDDAGAKANIFATIGPTDRAGVMLSGHTDVVPVQGQEWQTEPFQMTLRDDAAYGRGTADMKAFIAACLALAPEFLERGLRVPVHFAFSYDEEVGCLGAHRLIAGLRDLPVLPGLCVVGEPTMMKVIIGHKGKKSVRCRVHGLESHSALSHRGVNAVEVAAEIIAFMREVQRRIREFGPRDPALEPPYTTVHTGLISGGTALNIVPKDCWFEFEIRNLPDDDPEALLAEIRRFADANLLPDMRAVHPQSAIEWEELNWTVGLHMRADDEATQFVSQLSGSNSTGKVAYATEAGLFQQAGIPTIVCGPGSIEQAHKPDEFISLDQIVQCEAFLRRLMDRICES